LTILTVSTAIPAEIKTSNTEEFTLTPFVNSERSLAISSEHLEANMSANSGWERAKVSSVIKGAESEFSGGIVAVSIGISRQFKRNCQSVKQTPIVCQTLRTARKVKI